MVKAILVLFTLTVLSTEAFSAVNFTCRGNHNGLPVKLFASLPSSTATGSISGTVQVDGRDVAFFRKGEMKVSLLSRTFKAKNNHGDQMDGKVVDMGNKQGNITRLQAPGSGIDFWNIALDCR